MAQEPQAPVDLSDVKVATRRTNSLPFQQNITTAAIVHHEQSPWSSVNTSSCEVVNGRRTPCRAASMRTIKPGDESRKTGGGYVVDDINVKYSWKDCVKVETRTDPSWKNEDEELKSSSAGGEKQQGAVSTYDNNGGSLPGSEGQSDYQQPLSVASDQWSCTYDPTAAIRDGPNESTRGATAAVDTDTDMPFYVNTSSLAADGGGDEYMQVLGYSADDEADNVYLSLLDIVSIEERQIQVRLHSHRVEFRVTRISTR